MAGSPSHSQQDDDLQIQNPTPTVAPAQQPDSVLPAPSQQPEVPNPETLETSDHTNPQPLTLDLDDHENQNPKQLNKGEDTLLVLDEEDEEVQLRCDNQSGTIIPPSPSRTTTEEIKHSPPPPPVTLTSPTNHRRPNKRKKGSNRNPIKRKYSMIKFQALIDKLNPIPFIPTKTLDFDKHEEVLKRLGLWEFSKIEFDRSIRIDVVSQLIVNFDSRKRCSYVDESRVNVNRADLARALKLPLTKQEKGSSTVEEVDLDSEVFSDEAIRFVEDFVMNWMLLHEDTWMMPPEVANWTRCIKDGHPEKMDSASLIWYMVEKELTKGDKLVDCYYASHLQYLVRSQRGDLFKSMMEVEEVKEEDDGVSGDGEADGNPNVEEENIALVQEKNIELTLGPDVEEEVHEDVKKDDEMMVDDEESKEEEEEEEHGNWLLDGKNVLGEHFLQRCEDNDLNYEDRKLEEVEDEQVEEVNDDDDNEEEEEVGQRVEDGFDMEANDDSLERDGLTDNFLEGMEASHIPFGSQGELRGMAMASVDLFGSRNGSFMGHGGPSFFGNGGKRVMEPEEDIHHLEGNNKRLKTNELWDQKENDFGVCMEQMHQWMEKAKMVYESKEQTSANLQFNHQLEINQLQERQNFMEMYIKSKDEELEKKNVEVFRLERELNLMGELLDGYRKALDDTRYKFSEYKKRYVLREEPIYKDAGPGGLVLSARELEKIRLKQEEEERIKILMVAKDLEEEWHCNFDVHFDKVLMMNSKLVSIENEMKRLKESSVNRKEIQKKGHDEQELSAQVEEQQKCQNEQELSAQREEHQKSQEELELSAQQEESQKSQGEILENVTNVQIVPPTAAESQDIGGDE